MGEVPLNVGFCVTHQKLLYTSRKVAKRHARRVHPDDSMSAYPCDVLTHLWHIGHLPQVVKRGRVTRDTIWRNGKPRHTGNT